MKLLKSCQVCRDGEQLKFLQKRIGTHILFKRYWQFSCCTGEARKCPWALRAAPCFSASRACTALCSGLLLAPWLQLYTGLCAGVRGWAGFAGALARSWLPRALNEGLIRAIAGFPVKRRECTDSKFVLRMPTVGLCFEEKCLLSRNQPSLTPLGFESVMGLGGPL